MQGLEVDLASTAGGAIWVSWRKTTAGGATCVSWRKTDLGSEGGLEWGRGTLGGWFVRYRQPQGCCSILFYFNYITYLLYTRLLRDATLSIQSYSRVLDAFNSITCKESLTIPIEFHPNKIQLLSLINTILCHQFYLYGILFNEDETLVKLPLYGYATTYTWLSPRNADGMHSYQKIRP